MDETGKGNDGSSFHFYKNLFTLEELLQSDFSE